MPELLTLQDLANGHLDVKALGEAANGDENTIVTTRTGNTYPSAERAINIMFQNGGLPAKPFATKAKMETDGASLADGQLAQVYNETANNGLYVKDAGAWVKATYDPVGASKSYADSNPLFKPQILVDGVNLDTKKKSGKFICSINAIAKLSLNYPFEAAGELEVSEVISTGVVVQTYKAYATFGMAIRATNGSGVFGSWSIIATKSDTAALSTSLSAAILASKNPVDLSSDNSINLNNHTQQGASVVYSSKPTSENNFPELNVQGVVLNYTLTNTTHQIFMVRGTTRAYIRSYWGTNGWTAWDLLITESKLKLELEKYDNLLTNDNLNKALTSPTKPYRMKLIGDSITWGMGSSAGSPIEPRTGYLTDSRNTTDFTSKTWANLLRQWIAKVYGDGLITEDRAGSAYTSRAITMTLSDYYKNIKMVTKAGEVLNDVQKLPLIDVNNDSVTGQSLNLLGASFAPTLRPNSLEFEIESDNLTVLYQDWAVGDINDKVDIFVDNVLTDSFNYYAEVANYKSSKTITFPMGVHKIKLVNMATKPASYAKIFGFMVNKKTWVINEGIIGLSTSSLLSRNILDSTLTGKEDLILFMLGTNDRADLGGLSGFKNRLHTSLDKIQSLSPSAQIVLMSSTFATNESPTTYKFNMGAVDKVISEVANTRGLLHISHYKRTAKTVMKGVNILSDGLHLNDLGNELFFDAIVDRLFI